MTKLSRAVRNRLTKLATYLEGLPEDYRHFGMRTFVLNRKGDAAVIEYARKNGGVQTCGTAACAAGHGPSAGILVPHKFISPNDFDVVDWFGYSLLFTGEGNCSTPLWEWLFGSQWAREGGDNHHWGAAARIRYILDGRPIPDDCSPFTDHREHVFVYREYDKRHALAGEPA